MIDALPVAAHRHDEFGLYFISSNFNPSPSLADAAGLLDGGSGELRQAEQHRRALAQRALHRDRAALHLHQCLGDR